MTLPKNPEVARAYEELEQRRANGDEPPLLVRLICHGRSVCLVWDLGPGRALAVANRRGPASPIIRARLGHVSRTHDIDASLVEQDLPDEIELSEGILTLLPHWCDTAAHPVTVEKQELRQIVKRARRSRKRTLTFILEPIPGGPRPGVRARITLLMVFVLQNTQNRDSAALHLKLDEIVHAEPDAREDVRGMELKSEAEIHGLSLEDAEALTSASGESPGE